MQLSGGRCGCGGCAVVLAEVFKCVFDKWRGYPCKRRGAGAIGWGGCRVWPDFCQMEGRAWTGPYTTWEGAVRRRGCRGVGSAARGWYRETPTGCHDPWDGAVGGGGAERGGITGQEARAAMLRQDPMIRGTVRFGGGGAGRGGITGQEARAAILRQDPMIRGTVRSAAADAERGGITGQEARASMLRQDPMIRGTVRFGGADAERGGIPWALKIIRIGSRALYLSLWTLWERSERASAPGEGRATESVAYSCRGTLTRRFAPRGRGKTARDPMRLFLTRMARRARPGGPRRAIARTADRHHAAPRGGGAPGQGDGGVPDNRRVDLMLDAPQEYRLRNVARTGSRLL